MSRGFLIGMLLDYVLQHVKVDQYGVFNGQCRSLTSSEADVQYMILICRPVTISTFVGDILSKK